MDVGGNAAAVVLDGRAAVLIDAHVDPVAIPVRRLVDGVVHDLPEDVVQSAHARGTDIHAGAQAHRVQPFENGDIARVIMLFRHIYLVKNAENFLAIIPYFAVEGKAFGQYLAVFAKNDEKPPQ